MKREVGLWIDHHKTVMVTMINEKEETREIRSNVEKHVRLSPGSPAKTSNNQPCRWLKMWWIAGMGTI